MKALNQIKEKERGTFGYLLWGIILAACFLIVGNPLNVKAVDVEGLRTELAKNRSGFPDDLAERPLTASSLKKGNISVYTDSDLIEQCAVVKGESLTITAVNATKEAIYGEYEGGQVTGDGWFSLDTFVENPSYTKEYATVREEMPIYKNKDYKGGSVTIEKYSGIILVTKSGSKRQVIYETEDGYGIGWIKSENYENTLEYDGRPKQQLADGSYVLSSLNASGSGQQAAGRSYHLTFLYGETGGYYIFDQKNRLLTLGEDESGLEQEVFFREKEPTKSNEFRIIRTDGGYQIQHMKTGYYLGESVDKTLKIYTDDMGKQTEWKVGAESKMVDVKQPMVFTQYDPEWCGEDYGSEGCIGTAGCGILAIVNAVYSLSGQYMDVMELADYAVEKNYRIVESGTADGIFKASAKEFGEKYGFAWDGSSQDLSVLTKKLKAGDTAISHVEGHYVAIVSCSADGKKFLILDSNRLPSRETSAFGDWVDIKRLKEGALSSTGYFFLKQQNAE